jgi:hypothetical protein
MTRPATCSRINDRLVDLELSNPEMWSSDGRGVSGVRCELSNLR